MLKRKAISYLREWRKKNRKKCLIVSGPRQVGKSFIVQQFGKEYTSFIEINFYLNPSLTNIFDDNLDSETILSAIRLNNKGFKIVPGNTLVFLDEIQLCQNAITALKFLAQDERIDVIASGSTLGIEMNRNTSWPVGFVDYYDMYSLDFEEFLWSRGVEEDLIEQMYNYYINCEVVPLSIHNVWMKYLKEYMVIGGMPEIVDHFIQNDDYSEVDDMQRTIVRDYIADIARYAPAEIRIKAQNCYMSIPSQLSKTNHKFQYKIVEEKGTSRKFGTSLDWLISAGVVVPSYRVNTISYPLSSFEDNTNVRIYPSDIGLLIGQYDYSLKRYLLSEEMDMKTNSILTIAKGGIYEALAADMLYKKGYNKIHFYRNDAGTVEMEFLLDYEKGVLPIEIKAGRHQSKSLWSILKNESISFGIKFASQNVGKKEKIKTLPLYMIMFI